MKKLILLGLSILLLTGCEESSDETDEHNYHYIEDGMNETIYVDKDTCVEYFSVHHGGTTVLYNADGSVKLNKDCISKHN